MNTFCFSTLNKFSFILIHFFLGFSLVQAALIDRAPQSVKSSSAPIEKRTYMDCQSTGGEIKRVVLKANRKNDVLSQFEIILVDQEGKSHMFPSPETLDGRYLDPQTLKTKNIQLIGKSKESHEVDGAIVNPTAINLFPNESAVEDMACLSATHKADPSALDGQLIKNKKIVNEVKFHKYSGVLIHKNQLIQLSCFSPMVPRDSNCDLNTDSKTAGEVELNSL